MKLKLVSLVLFIFASQLDAGARDATLLKMIKLKHNRMVQTKTIKSVEKASEEEDMITLLEYIQQEAPVKCKSFLRGMQAIVSTTLSFLL